MSVTIPSIDTPQSSSHPTELWAIIEKQRDIIQELQKALIDMAAERDVLLNKIKDPTPTSSSSSSFTEESTANNSVSSNSTATKIPIPPPRSPFRPNNITSESLDSQKTIPPPLPPPIPPIKKKFSADERHSSYAAKLQNKDLIIVDDPVANTIEYEGTANALELKVSSMLSNSFILSVVNKKTHQEMWQIEKTLSDLLVLDTTLKSNLNNLTINSNTRSSALIEDYLANVIHYLNYDKIAICFYSFIVQKQIKAGYLTKRGKYDTGSKKYYFIMNDESELKYFSTNEDGQLLMWNIPLVPETRIGKQSKKSGDPTLFYHAFVILFDSTTCKSACQPYKYILCAESDADRDDWVKILLLHSQQQKQQKKNKLTLPKNNSRYVRSDSDTLIRLPAQDLLNKSSADMMPANRPIRHKVYQRSSMDDKAILRYYQSIENNESCSQYPLSNKASADSLPNIVDLQELNQQLKAKKEKTSTNNNNRKSFWSPKNFFPNGGVNQHNTISFPFNASVNSQATENITSFFNNRAPKYPVFGVPLEEAIQATKISESCELPSILYRCIEFLEAKDAVHEEGIYRLSGSSALVSSLRQQFCEYGDVDILSLAQQDPYLDVHVVAGLLKMWLRELPVNVLTNDLIPDFLSAISKLIVTLFYI